ncbi:hypothetical protein LTR78_004239 [Recurvomyces mirabilis]|uniref:BZIP transcription factor n=1 Tax=Recurvomyces mirabilis TaxID=574656 RepID=A0AAE1C337_9PEZI|nr:hypothetical protein LTR78_004239 [Recurvomyces mirabilis]KAK5153591.1 hypothetical protein LTS14_007285 [Recurvomyces mirabilis]
MATSHPSVYPSHGSAYPTHSPQATAAAALSEQLPSLQQQQEATSNKKRKTSGAPGSRGVANLTPEQLSKKRANDREAQRAIRERTRNTIQNLEQRIRELESQQPFQELQRALSERDNALRECEDLRRRLAGVAQLAGTSAAAAALQQQHGGQAGPIASLNGTFTIDDLIDPVWLNPDGAELAAVTAQQAPLPPHPASAAAAHQQQGQYPGYADHVHPALRSPSYATTHGSPVSQASRPDSSARHGQWSPSVSAVNSQQGSQYPSHGNGAHYDNQLPSPTALLQQSGNGERLGLNYIMDSKASPQNSPPLYARLPANMPPASPLDSLLSDFIATRRQLLQSGKTKLEALGPEYPSFAALHDPSKKSSSHPVSNLLIDILSKFPDISALPEKVAVLYIMFLVLRWFICPCSDCYERMPEWCRPVVEQLERQHPHWVDHLPWLVESSSSSSSSHAITETAAAATTPEEEEEIDFAELFGDDVSPLALSPITTTATAVVDETNEVENNGVVEYLTDTFFRPYMRKQLSGPAQKKFDDFFVPFTTTLSLNWSASSESKTVLVQLGSEQGQLTSEFEQHLRNLRNWSLGTSFQTTFPDLVNEEVRISGPAV